MTSATLDSAADVSITSTHGDVKTLTLRFSVHAPFTASRLGDLRCSGLVVLERPLLGTHWAHPCRSPLPATDSCLGWVISVNRKLVRATSSRRGRGRSRRRRGCRHGMCDGSGRRTSGSSVGSLPPTAWRWCCTPLRGAVRWRATYFRHSAGQRTAEHLAQFLWGRVIRWLRILHRRRRKDVRRRFTTPKDSGNPRSPWTG
jgi:hypothetical protein